MLEALKKKLGISPVVKEEVEMVEEKTGASVPVVENAAMEALQASFTAQTEQFTALQSQFAEVMEKLAALDAALAKANAELAVVEAAKAAALAEAHKAKMAARKSLVVANIGEEKADAFLAATEMLDDAAFEAVSSALAGSVAAEADTALFNEVGVDAKADASKNDVEESEEMKILKQKYAAQSANK